MVVWLAATWKMLETSAPWLLIGFFIAGVLHVFIPRELINRSLSISGWRSVLFGSLFGIPLPLCSCSVIPVATTLRKHGASRGATASFLISTPEIGIDSFLMSQALLGLPLTLLRLVAAFLSALTAGLWIDALHPHADAPRRVGNERCCCTPPAAPDPNTNETLISLPRETPVSGAHRVRALLRYAFIDLARDLAPLLVAGYLVGGAFSTLVPEGFFLELGFSPVLAILLMIAASFPVYVCATSATPIAAGMFVAGIPPGAILAFLLAGPASNITTVLAIRQALGKDALVPYLLSVSGVTFLLALLVEYALPGYVSVAPLPFEHRTYHDHTNTVGTGAAVMLCALLLPHLYKTFRRLWGRFALGER